MRGRRFELGRERNRRYTRSTRTLVYPRGGRRPPFFLLKGAHLLKGHTASAPAPQMPQVSPMSPEWTLGRVVGAEGFEPPTLCSQSRCATRLRHAPHRTGAARAGRRIVAASSPRGCAQRLQARRQVVAPPGLSSSSTPAAASSSRMRSDSAQFFALARRGARGDACLDLARRRSDRREAQLVGASHRSRPPGSHAGTAGFASLNHCAGASVNRPSTAPSERELRARARRRGAHRPRPWPSSPRAPCSAAPRAPPAC